VKETTDSIEARISRITVKLESMAVPMDKREFTIEEYRRVFPQGTVKTPLGEVRIGQNQFSKLAEKDGGNRRALIGAMQQTLSDPIIIIEEKKDDRAAYVFIKSFNSDEDQKISIIVSVVVTINSNKVAISTYKRKKREVLNKIKMADVVAFEKDYGASPTNGNLTRH
jgi:hypothetical protein